jgi:hypothetical protein
MIRSFFVPCIVCTLLIMDVCAAPIMSGAVLCELQTLKLNSVSSAFPEPLSTEVFLGKQTDEAHRYAAVKPYELIKWVEASFYHKTTEVTAAPKVDQELRNLFRTADWTTDRKSDDNVMAKQIGFAAPHALMVLKDDASASVEWILEVWPLGVRLSVAHHCGVNAYQLHPDSKRTLKMDPSVALVFLGCVDLNKKAKSLQKK